MIDTKEIIKTYRGWDKFDKDKNKIDIIDFDLAITQECITFDSHIQILNKLINLYENSVAETPEEEFIKAKLNASIYFLRALMGEQIPFYEYIKNTMGIEARYFDYNEIEKAKIDICELLSEFGIDFSPQYKENFNEIFIIKDPEIVKKQIIINKDFWLKKLKNFINLPEEINVKLEFASVDDYWSNWITGSRDKGILLQINLHPRIKYYEGRPLVLCLHEICGHAVQMTIWSYLIQNGLMNEFCGLTTVHTPEAFLHEGIAQAVSEFIDSEESFPVEFLLTKKLSTYTLMIFNNVHIMVNEGVPVQEVHDFAIKYLPFTSTLSIESEIRDRSRNPLNRAYQFVYAPSEVFFKKAISNLSENDKKKFVQQAYFKPMTPNQLSAFVSSFRIKQFLTKFNGVNE